MNNLSSLRFSGHPPYILAPTMFVLCLSLLVGACGSAEERKAVYLEKAEKFLDEGNFPKARVALKNAVKIDPKDAHTYFLLARVAEKEQEWSQAFGNYLHILDLDPNHRAALTRLARFYLAGQQKQKVSEIAGMLFKQNPHDQLGETLRASVLFMDGEKNKSLAKAQEIAVQNPTDAETLILLAAVFSANKEFEKAHALLKSGLAAQPEDVDLLNNVATTYLAMGKPQEAQGVLQKIIDVEPHVFAHHEKLAKLYLYLKQPDQARAVIRKAVEREPDNEDRWKQLVAYSEPSQREQVLLDALEQLPHSLSLRFLLGQLYEFNKQPEKARATYEAIVAEEETSDPGLKAEVQLARMDFSDKKQELANSRLEKVLHESPRQADALLLKGKIALGEREGKEAVQAFRTVLKDNPNQSTVLNLLGKGHLLSGEFQLAHESFEKAVELNPRQFDAAMALARLSVKNGDYPKAQQYLESILTEAPNHLETLGFLFKVYVAQNQWSEAEKVLVRLREAKGSPYAIDLADGLLAQARQQWDRSKKSFEKAMKAKPNELAPLTALIKQELFRKRSAEAERYLKQLVAKNPEHPYASGLLGAVLVQRKDQPAALSAYKRQTEVNPAWIDPWRDWAMLEWSSGKKTEAIRILKQGFSLNPDAIQLATALASLYQANEQIDLAIQEYEAILVKNPGAVAAANNLAYLLTDKKGDQESLARALALTKSFNSKTPNPLLLDTLAWVHHKLGNHSEAVSLLRNAVEKAPTHPLLNYHYEVVSIQAGDSRTAKKHIE
ncbi:MAG: tetratricopeptide repeat protein, partial [Nitrospira sp.]|nr:tetratricopeptide repeat protein [Nitrospira sp.]